MSFEKYESVIQACFVCATHCEICGSECLREKNIESVTRCIELTKNCAAMCLLTARFLSGGSEFIPQVCNLCAEICQACADECAKLYMDTCAQYCRDCAEECNALTLEFA
jgi:hypothetical protein